MNFMNILANIIVNKLLAETEIMPQVLNVII